MKRRRDPLAISERQFLQQVVELARLCGWLVYHTHDSRHSTAGFPDLCLLKGTVCLMVELKSNTGTTTPQQKQWLEAFQTAGVTACVWRSANWDTIVRTLKGEP